MSDYTKLTNFAAKDALATGNASKRVKGSEIDTEFNNIAVAVATKANSASPTFSGTVTAAALTASGLLTVTGNRVTVSNATTPMYEMHVPGVIAAALSCASGESLRLHVTNGGGTLSTKLLSMTPAGILTAPLQCQVQAYAAANQTSGTDLLFGTETRDSQAAFNTGTGVFTAPVAGVYAVCGTPKIVNNTAGTVNVIIQIQVDGAAVHSNSSNLTAFVTQSVPVSGVVYCNAGSTIKLYKTGGFSGTVYVQGDVDSSLSIMLIA